MYVREEREGIPHKIKDILELEEWWESPVKQGIVIAFGDCIVYKGPWDPETNTRKVWIEPRSYDCTVMYREINGHTGEGRVVIYVFYNGVWHELQRRCE
jgi:hypothetical protein